MASLTGQHHRNVLRYEHNYFTGWVVRIVRRKNVLTCYFPDQGDPEQALRRALAWRDDRLQDLPPPVKIRLHWPKNTTGVIGVALAVETNRRGVRVERYVAAWIDAQGKRRKRSFAIGKYGRQAARELAFRARAQAEADIMASRPKGPLPPRPGRKRMRIRTEAKPPKSVRASKTQRAGEGRSRSPHIPRARPVRSRKGRSGRGRGEQRPRRRQRHGPRVEP